MKGLSCLRPELLHFFISRIPTPREILLGGKGFLAIRSILPLHKPYAVDTNLIVLLTHRTCVPYDCRKDRGGSYPRVALLWVGSALLLPGIFPRALVGLDRKFLIPLL